MRCEHDLEKLVDGFKLFWLGYSPTILKCKKCKKMFQLDIGTEDKLKPILIEE